MTPRRGLSLFALVFVACGTEKVTMDPFTSISASGGNGSATGEDTGDTGGSGTSTSTTDPGDTTVATTGVDSSGTDEGSAGSSETGVNVCGDGILGPDEPCDGDLFSETCESLGFGGGELLCHAQCIMYSTELCFVCGDGIIQGAETCEGDESVPDEITCEGEGFTEGTVTCDPVSCQYNFDGCSLCGDGMIMGNEDCDTDDVGASTCESIGLIAGDLACNNASCTFDISDCETYFQDFEGEMMLPMEFTPSGVQPWTVESGANALMGMDSGRSGQITHSQTSGMVLTLNFPVAGTISFFHEESSEGSFDYLQFYVDNVMQEEWSGLNATQQETYNVAAGMHTFEWRYEKDGSVNSNMDRVWVDDIFATGQLP